MKIELNDTCVYRRTANDNVMILIGHYVKVLWNGFVFNNFHIVSTPNIPLN